MASCRIEWKRSAERDLRGIDRKQIPRIIAAVGGLAHNPTSVGGRKLADGFATAGSPVEKLVPLLGELRFYKRFLDEVAAIEEENES